MLTRANGRMMDQPRKELIWIGFGLVLFVAGWITLANVGLNTLSLAFRTLEKAESIRPPLLIELNSGKFDFTLGPSTLNASEHI